MYNYDHRVAARTDGPWIHMDDRTLIGWVREEIFGRVHHVTSSLAKWEKLLIKARDNQADILSRLDIPASREDVFVDGKGGRNLMEIYYTISIRGGWSQEQQEAYLAQQGSMNYFRGFKQMF